MKQSVMVYIVGAVVALIVLQAAIGLFMSELPMLVFLAGGLVALLCGYAIMNERGRRIEAVDRLLGIGLPADTVRAVGASATVPNAATISERGTSALAQEDASESAAFEQTAAITFQHRDNGSGDHGESATAADASLEPPQPPTTRRVDYAGLIDDIKSKPVTITQPSLASQGAGSQARTTSAPQAIDYGRLVGKLQNTRPEIPTKEQLIDAISAKVIGQRSAVEILATYVRGKLGARDTGKNKPLVFLLPGPTGTGKTEISKAIAEALGTKLVRFDMGEYGEEYKASNLFGSAKGYIGSEDGGALPNAIRQGGKRFVVLFDEVEKGHQSIWQKLLAFMDEGRCGDSKGDVVGPKDTIVLLTTNRRAEEIGEAPENAKDILRHDGYFSPEFLGRVEKIVPMPRLTDADMMHLTHRLLDVLAKSYGLSIAVDEDSLALLYTAARENAERAGGRGITETLRDILIEDILELQGNGHEIGRLTVEGGRLRAVPA